MPIHKLKKLRIRWESRRFRVGLLVIASATLFLSLIVFIVGSSLGSRLRVYHVMFEESVKGMAVGSRVNFQGIPVGSVTDIRFQNGKTRVTIGVDPDKATIQDQTHAHMDRLLITGQVTVELEGYQRNGKPLAEGEVIPAKLSAFDAFTRSLPEVISSTDDVLGELRRLLAGLAAFLTTENQQHVSKTLQNIAECSTVLAKRLDPMMSEAQATLQTVRPAMRTVEQSFARIGELAAGDDFKASLASARDALARLDRVERELFGLLQELNGLARGSRRQVLETLSSARSMIEDVRQLARDLRSAPNAVIFGRQDGTAQPPARPGKE